ncbi:MAG TPA: DUF3696 domain-containing protein [Bacteroidales bacterium]|nr:DUF3696 domain-containing protein [Bacteroidales bacterium]
MINKIEIENFKSIKNAIIDTGYLNVFTGVNGSGKSSFLQSLLLLRQSFNSGSFFRNPFSLNLGSKDSLVNLGTFKDVLCQHAEKNNERISINVDINKKNLSFVSENYDTDNRDLNFLNGKLNQNISNFENANLFTGNFQYLAAERIQPSEDYPRFQSTEFLGKQGEYTAHFIEKYKNDDIPIRALSFKEKPISFSLINQINDWMGEISDSIEVIVKENLNINRIELSYRYRHLDGIPSQNQKPQNVGFGITHTLPIVVAILSAKPNDIIVIENPETHLHPKGQSALSYLFSLAAQNNVQLFIETHSDHIINGLRVAVKKNMIDKDNIYLYYFTKTNKNISDINRIRVQMEGGLDIWPPNFFDQATRDLNYLFGI